MFLSFLFSLFTSPVIFACDYIVLTRDFLQTFAIRYLNPSTPVPTYLKKGQFPTIPNVPWSERIDFWSHRGPVYLRRIIQSNLYAAYKALFEWETVPISNEEMAYTFGHSGYSKYLLKVEEVNWMPDGKRTASPGYSYWIADFSFMSKTHPSKGMYATGSRVCFQIYNHNPGIPIPVGIRLEQKEFPAQVILPHHAAWDSAKLFVMHGASHYFAFIEHPKLHFPFDTINAITKTMPKEHVIRQLLAPHQRFTLTLNDTVLNNQYFSIFLNRWMPQCPFDNPKIDTQSYLEQCKLGWEWTTEPYSTENPTHYGEFTKRYFLEFRRFVAGLVDADPLQFRDQTVIEWANGISVHLPGFPTGKQILEGDMIVKVLAKIMWNVSVEHSADHYSYYMNNWNTAPWRVRVPPPTCPSDEIDFRKVSTRVDMWKFVQGEQVLFYPGSQFPLGEIDYNFRDRRFQELNARFRQNLQDVDEIYDEARFMDLVSCKFLDCLKTRYSQSD